MQSVRLFALALGCACTAAFAQVTILDLQSAGPGGQTTQAAALPDGAHFKVTATKTVMPGGMDSNHDDFQFLVEGDDKALKLIDKIEYTVDEVKAGEANRNFILEGTVARDRWPIAVKVTWKDGKVTRTTLARP
jgi:hypothetical protein